MQAVWRYPLTPGVGGSSVVSVPPGAKVLGVSRDKGAKSPVVNVLVDAEQIDRDRHVDITIVGYVPGVWIDGDAHLYLGDVEGINYFQKLSSDEDGASNGCEP